MISQGVAMTSSTVDRPVEKKVIGKSEVKEPCNDPLPESLLVPVNDGNVYLTILLGAAVMKAGLSGLCQGRGKFPPQCFVNPQTVYNLRETSPKYLNGTYDFDELLPEVFNETVALNGYFFGTGVWIDVYPDDTIKEGFIEFCCRQA